MTSLAVPSNETLPNLCGGLLTLGLGLRRAKDPGAADQLRQHIGSQLAALDRAAADAGFAAADVQLAKYALVAYIDEIILSSHWDIRQEWASRPLQMEYFNDFTAGEQFYQNLETMRQRGDERGLDLVEVYALCLGLGFKGKHADFAGLEHLKVLMTDLSREIKAGRHVPAGLSPSWQVEERLDQQVKNLPIWTILAAGAGVLLLLFFLLDLLLGWDVAPLLEGQEG